MKRASLGMALAGLSACMPEVGLYEQQHARSHDAGAPVQDAARDASAARDSGVVLVLPQPDAAVGEPDVGACGASVLSATSVVVEKEVEVRTDVVTAKPATFYLMFDQSLSMGVSQLWKPAVSALKSFLTSDRSKEVSVGLQYFPIANGQCSTGAGYVTPDVPSAMLPENVAALERSLDSHAPAGLGTPIQGALKGVTEYCKVYQAAHPGEQCVSILATDGKPELAIGCEEDPTELAAIAKRAHEAGVITFAVGLKGANFALLDEIARQGGAPDCDPTQPSYACDVSQGPDKLADALASIRDSIVTTSVHTELVKKTERVALSCEWTIPARPDEFHTFDRDKVNIRLSYAGDTNMLVRVGAVEDCTDNAWYYDNPNAPTRFIACPSVCDAIEKADDAKVDILLGCQTWLPE
ncbi:MAG TPA: vWA domain-containing protein [Polyangiales bacterium]|nr:vWA domain-containing protein [Polyangiales bacterium]